MGGGGGGGGGGFWVMCFVVLKGVHVINHLFQLCPKNYREAPFPLTHPPFLHYWMFICLCVNVVCNV